MGIYLKTSGSCESVAPAFGATAVFTVTAVKLPWEGKVKRSGDENNGLSYCIVIEEKEGCEHGE